MKYVISKNQMNNLKISFMDSLFRDIEIGGFGDLIWWRDSDNEEVLSYNKRYMELDVQNKTFENIKTMFNLTDDEAETLIIKWAKKKLNIKVAIINLIY